MMAFASPPPEHLTFVFRSSARIMLCRRAAVQTGSKHCRWLAAAPHYD